MIYCCGLRPVEARRLRREDVSLRDGVVKILESKGHKDRIVVLSESMLALCVTYDQRADTIYPDRKYFFQSPKCQRRWDVFYGMDDSHVPPVSPFRRYIRIRRGHPENLRFETLVCHTPLVPVDKGRKGRECLPCLFERVHGTRKSLRYSVLYTFTSDPLY
ncbi:MAG: tyrosine-type recombinase/integrase [Oscillospiraceae bacterium]